RVEVDVGDHRDRREPHDRLQRLGVLDLRDGAADDLAACGRERGDLRGRRLDVVRLRERHRLHDDGRAPADLDVAYVDDAFAGHYEASLAASYVPDVIRKPYDEQEQDERDSDRGDALVDGAPHRPAAD